MSDTYAIRALRRKRARLAGEIEQAEFALGKHREELVAMDAVVRIFEPAFNPELIRAVRPRPRRNPFFKHGEQPRLCLDVLRSERKPLSASNIAQCLIDLKGLKVEQLARRHLNEQVRLCLHRLADKGCVRKIVQWPETWWELDGQHTVEHLNSQILVRLHSNMTPK